LQIRREGTRNLTIFTMNCCDAQQEEEEDQEQLLHVAAREKPLAALQVSRVAAIFIALQLLRSLSPTGKEARHPPPSLQLPICLNPRRGRASQEVEGGRRDGKEGSGEWRQAARCECLVASSGYKYKNTEKEGLLYKSAGRGPTDGGAHHGAEAPGAWG